MNDRNGNIARGLGALGLALGLMLAQGSTASAQARLTTQTVVDRAEIEDLLARYYWNFGNDSPDSFGAFYSRDAELVLGKNSYKGLKGIAGAYAGVPKDAPQKKSFSFNVLMSNPLIVLHGGTATAQLVFTEFVIDKQGDAPRVLTQGREFDHLVKEDGRWRISKRQIMAANARPDDWPK